MTHLHIRPGHRISGVFLQALTQVTNAELWGIAANLAIVAYMVSKMRNVSSRRFDEPL